jgi:polyisoprenoid-binding protein YceI
MTVKGQFADYDGTLDLSASPAVELTIQAASLDTKMAKRDAHLRSGDFFGVETHPQVRFISDSTLDGYTLRVHGQLQAGGRQIPLELDATVREIDRERRPPRHRLRPQPRQARPPPPQPHGPRPRAR